MTADDVVFTVDALKSPDAAGGAPGSWADVTAEATDDKTVLFKLDAPIAGFLARCTQPLLPAHLLKDVPYADLATSEFARLPVGSGPYAISEIDATHALLVPAETVLPGAQTPGGRGLAGTDAGLQPGRHSGAHPGRCAESRAGRHSGSHARLPARLELRARRRVARPGRRRVARPARRPVPRPS